MSNKKFQIPEEDFVVKKPSEIAPEQVVQTETHKTSPNVVQPTVTEAGPKVILYGETYTDNTRSKAPFTQGKKGQALPRLHLALTPINYDYLKLLARKSGNSYSGFINSLLDLIREGDIDVTRHFRFD